MKEKYDILAKKYKLPNFTQINEDFDLSKFDFNEETLLREIRKAIVTKVTSVLQFLELILNPSSGSMFHMFLVRGIKNGEVEKINKLFESLGTIEINALELDINYNEVNEADFIRKTFNEWQNSKRSLSEIISSIKQNWNKTQSKKEKSYLG